MKIKFNRLDINTRKIINYLINKISYNDPCEILKKYNLDKIEFKNYQKYIYKKYHYGIFLVL